MRPQDSTTEHTPRTSKSLSMQGTPRVPLSLASTQAGTYAGKPVPQLVPTRRYLSRYLSRYLRRYLRRYLGEDLDNTLLPLRHVRQCPRLGVATHVILLPHHTHTAIVRGSAPDAA